MKINPNEWYSINFEVGKRDILGPSYGCLKFIGIANYPKLTTV